MKRKLRLLAIPARYCFTLFLTFFALAAVSQRTVKGKVTGPDAKPVFGATVAVKNTNVATTTDADGSYSITLPANTNVLVFSFVGYDVSEVSATGDNVDVVMKLQTTTLNEVVVTGYSSQRKKDITGAVAVVNVNELKVIPTTDAGSQLQGRASGVTVTLNGVPGGASTVRIRGLGSFNNNSPLYVIDGVQSGNISGLNPNDIESMQVLKDAASGSIYGVRGSNGVIIVTTKKGKKRGVSVTYDMYYGNQIPGDGFDLLNGQEEADLLFLAKKNSNLATTGSVFGNGATAVLPDYIFYTGAANNGVPIMTGNPGVDPNKYQLDYKRLGDP